MEKRNVTLHVRVSDDTAAALKKLATADKRTVSSYLAMLIDKHIEETSQKAEKPTKKGGRP
jgi:predicted DNA-binding protein